MRRAEHDDTIVAIATPPGEGGVGIVRLSGPAAIAIAAGCFRSAHGRDPHAGSGRIFHGHVVDAAGAPLDEVLLHVMRAPHSFTREDVAEINAHGSSVGLRAIVARCLAGGARLARPGEFTLRAFLNGRLDLVQAEAVLDTVQAHTEAVLRAAQAAAGGALSQEIDALREQLTQALARIEAAVDFPEDDLPELVDEAVLRSLDAVVARCAALLQTARTGRLLREGASVALIGRPNVGKSSLFNALLRHERAIVTPEAGTTRDRLEEHASIGGLPVRLIDTAGLRESGDAVERIGVARAREALRDAAVAVLVVAADAGGHPEDHTVAKAIAEAGCPVVLVVNKCDLAPDAPLPDLPLSPRAALRCAAATGAGMAELESALAEVLADAPSDAGAALLTRQHQEDSVRRAQEHVQAARAAAGASPEFLALDVRAALDALGEVTGETTPDAILQRVFESFCIGK